MVDKLLDWYYAHTHVHTFALYDKLELKQCLECWELRDYNSHTDFMVYNSLIEENT